MNKCIDDIYYLYDICDQEIKVIIIERQEYTLDEIKEKYPNMDIDNIPKRIP